MTTTYQTTLSIGVIGLGAMGKGMASSLRRAGHHVGVCDVRFDTAEAFAKEGGTAYKTPADLAKHVDIIVSVVVVNANGARSPALVRAHLVLGKSQAPSAPTGASGTSRRPPAWTCW